MGSTRAITGVTSVSLSRAWVPAFAGMTVLVLLLTLLAVLPVRADERVLNVYNWTDYIDPAELERFTEEIRDHRPLRRVRQPGDAGGEAACRPFRLRHRGAVERADLFPADQGGRAGRDRSRARAELEEPRSGADAPGGDSDPGNRHGAIYLWGTTGIGVNPERIKQLAPDAPLDSWDLLFNPENAKRIAPCGITMMDFGDRRDPGVLQYLGRSPTAPTPADLAAVEHTLMAHPSAISASFACGGALEALATGQSCLALDYSGDVIQAAHARTRRSAA